MSKAADHTELDAQSHAALERFFDRINGWSQVDNAKPGDSKLDVPFKDWEGKMFDECLLEPGLDGCEEEVGEYELRQRKVGVRIFFRYLACKGIHPASMLRWLVCIGRAMHEAPFHLLTMHEAAQLMDETPAAHSYRCKVLSSEIRLHGMSSRVLGDRLPGQKTQAASQSYKKCRKGNCNRKGGKKEQRRRERAKRHEQRPAVPTAK